jgi:8-oxo-dGTP diphosphatase
MTQIPGAAPAPVPYPFIGPDGAVQRIRPGAYAWCERDGCVLLVRLSDETPWSGAWTLPGGGLEFGEDPEAGLLRELVEETGLRGHLAGLVAVLSRVLEPGETVSGHRVHTLSLLYRAEVEDGELRHEAEGSTDVAAWVPLDRLDDHRPVPLLAWARSVVGR